MPKRRGHGEGGLFRRNKGTPRESWVARMYLEDRTRKEVYAQTQAEARQKLQELKRAAELDLALRSPRQELRQVESIVRDNREQLPSSCDRVLESVGCRN
jgi:hypothetical protein